MRSLPTVLYISELRRVSEIHRDCVSNWRFVDFEVPSITRFSLGSSRPPRWYPLGLHRARCALNQIQYSNRFRSSASRQHQSNEEKKIDAVGTPQWVHGTTFLANRTPSSAGAFTSQSLLRSAHCPKAMSFPTFLSGNDVHATIFSPPPNGPLVLAASLIRAHITVYDYLPPWQQCVCCARPSLGACGRHGAPVLCGARAHARTRPFARFRL